MQKKSSSKPLIILGIVVVLGGLLYFYFAGAPTDPSDFVDDNPSASPVSNEAIKILTLLNETSSLKIDAALFTSSVYKSLVDHTVPVIEQPVGKPNPFFYTIPAPSTPTVIKR